MKKGFLDSRTGIPTEGELELINKLSRRHLVAEEVFAFSVVLCDNEVDRDFERFSTNALNALSKLYLGKSGIFDHSMKGKDQLARIFQCEVEEVEGRTSSQGEPYRRIKARAYMPRLQKNKDIILEIDAGIKKEVSVGCAVSSSRCSICGKEVKTSECHHVKGREYPKNGNKALCHHILDNPTDAFEWSFVAVPAQREAGVVKAFSNKDGGNRILDMTALKKALGSGGGISFTESEAKSALAHIKALELVAEAGRSYTEALRQEVLRLSALCHPELDEVSAKSVIEKMDTQELLSFKSGFGAGAAAAMPIQPQLQPNEAPKAHSHKEFII